jgi:trans-aconitate methyltransferase
LERPVTDLYRSFFVDLDAEVALLHAWAPHARNILEIGCGEGAVVEKLAALYPEAAITGIDISPKAGRLFKNHPERVRFNCMTVAEMAKAEPSAFDLVLTCDVLHHVPWDQHTALLADARTLLQPGGTFVLKEWELIDNIAHKFCEFSDRVLTGDDVRFGPKRYFNDLLETSFGAGSVRSSATIRPWPNNIIFQCRATTP